VQEGRVTSQLPKGWVPEDVVLRAFARRNAGYEWETIVPEFSIAGMGRTLDEAIENAVELLDDYLMLCARDGMSFEASRRPLPVRTMAKLLAEFAVGRAVGRLSIGRPTRRRLDLPLNELRELHAANAH
jgi:hypothetical protein